MTHPSFATLAITAGLVASCGNPDHISVDLDITGANQAVIIRLDGQNLIPYDTLAITDKLMLELPLDSTRNTFYNVLFNTGSFIRIGLSDGDDITGYVDASHSLADYQIEGSAISQQLHALYQPVQQCNVVLDSLEARRNQLRGDEGNPLEREITHRQVMQSQYKVHRLALDQIMASDSSNLANVFGFFQRFAQVPLYQIPEDLALQMAYAEALIKAHPNHPLVQLFANQLASYLSEIEEAPAS
ncbi:MAG: hypothetical protein GWO75_01105 [Bacteroidetes bacterium]|nr:hypothetical protein [Bacteroidota bacterium]